jgi:hypothetical protein
MSSRPSRLQQLAVLFAEFAEAADDLEVDRALELCLGFGDRIICDREVEERIVELLRDSERTERNPLQRTN